MMTEDEDSASPKLSLLSLSSSSSSSKVESSFISSTIDVNLGALFDLSRGALKLAKPLTRSCFRIGISESDSLAFCLNFFSRLNSCRAVDSFSFKDSESR